LKHFQLFEGSLTQVADSGIGEYRMAFHQDRLVKVLEAGNGKVAYFACSDIPKVCLGSANTGEFFLGSGQPDIAERGLPFEGPSNLD
jgi:hypothetical protein